MVKIQDSNLRQEANSQSIWFPIPADILQVVMYFSINERILSTLAPGSNAGSWDKNGIYFHNKTQIYYCLLTTTAGLRSLRGMIKTNKIRDIINSTDLSGPAKYDALDNFADQIAAQITLGQPFEYTIHNKQDLIDRHFNPKTAGYVFVRDQSAKTQGGAIRVQSKPAGGPAVPIAKSNPILTEAPGVAVAQGKIGKPATDNPLAGFADAIEAMFSDIKNSSLVVNPEPRSPTYNINRGIVHHNDQTQFINIEGNRQLPVALIGRDSVIDYAHVHSKGHHSESTLNGLHTTEGPCRPSASFHPHAYWSNSLFTTPSGILKDPGTAALIIGLALLSSKSKEETRYVTNYKKTQGVIDNAEVDKMLYG